MTRNESALTVSQINRRRRIALAIVLVGLLASNAYQYWWLTPHAVAQTTQEADAQFESYKTFVEANPMAFARLSLDFRRIKKPSSRPAFIETATALSNQVYLQNPYLTCRTFKDSDKMGQSLPPLDRYRGIQVLKAWDDKTDEVQIRLWRRSAEEDLILTVKLEHLLDCLQEMSVENMDNLAVLHAAFRDLSSINGHKR